MSVPVFTDEVVFGTDPVAGYVGQAEALTSNPYAYWRLNDALASPTAADASGNGNTATVHGTVTFQTAGFTVNNKAATFNGTTGYLTVPDTASTKPSTALSLAGWFSFTGTPGASLGGTSYVIFQGNFYYLYLETFGSSVYLAYQAFDSASTGAIFNFIYPAAAVTASTTYHFALTDNGTTMILYLNGVQVAQLFRTSGGLTTGFAPTALGTLYIGANQGLTDFFTGVLDELEVIPDVVLTPQQIASLYASAPIPSTPQLVYTTLTGRPMRVSSVRGKQHELDAVQTGTANSQLLNIDQALDPTNTGSAYYPNVKPMRRIRRRAVINAVTYPVFSGFVERWPQVRVGRNYGDVPLQAVDGFEPLSLCLVTGTFPQESSGSRITRFLNLAIWPVGDRTIATGDTLVQALAISTPTSALSLIQDVERTERGLFYIARDGKATFVNRHATIPQTTSSVASFSDQQTAGSVYGYSNIVTSYDRDLIYNDWTDTPVGFPSPLHVEDAASIQQSFRRPQVISTQATTATDSLGGIQFALTQYKDAQLRVDSITLRPGNDTGFWQTVLARELYDRITVSGTGPGGVSFTKDFLIVKTTMDTPADVADTTVTWNLVPAGDSTSYWQAATAGFSEAATTTRAVW